MIEIKDLSVAFGNEKVLHSINTTIPEGEKSVIAGQSGSGKSVLVKTIEGIIRPLEGTVIIDGIDIFSTGIKKVNELRQKMSLLFQGSALFDSMNIFQNVAFPLVEHTSQSKKDITKKVEEKLELVGLPGILKKMPAELSGGMKKRAALARAIINDPKYIFYDEPTTGLDPQISDDIINLILTLQQRLKHTVIIITHDLHCISRTADKVIVLQKGIKRFEGSYQRFLKSDEPAVKQFQP